MSENGTTTIELPDGVASVTTSRPERLVIRRALKIYAALVRAANTKDINLGIPNPRATHIKDMLYPPTETGRSALVQRFLVEGDLDEPEERERTPKGDPAQLSIDDEADAAEASGNGADGEGTPSPVRSRGNFRKGAKRGSARGRHPGGGLSV